jgi:DNA-binding transcriptional regulator YhcF (GntR family)
MFLQVDYTSSRPLYEQIREQVHLMIDQGRLKAGDRLPPVRQLASDLATAPATVARAYRELEQDGVLKGMGRSGSVIVERRSILAPAERSRRLQQAAEQFATQARMLGVDLNEAMQALAKSWLPEQ